MRQCVMVLKMKYADPLMIARKSRMSSALTIRSLVFLRIREHHGAMSHFHDRHAICFGAVFPQMNIDPFLERR